MERTPKLPAGDLLLAAPGRMQQIAPMNRNPGFHRRFKGIDAPEERFGQIHRGKSLLPNMGHHLRKGQGIGFKHIFS
jgi:hypothetical protein